MCCLMDRKCLDIPWGPGMGGAMGILSRSDEGPCPGNEFKHLYVAQVAYVIAHPAFGTRELWRAFQESDGKGITDESPPGPEWTDKPNKSRVLVVANHVIDQEGKTFFPQGRIERALLDYVPSPYISVFYREDCRGASEHISTPKPNGKDIRSSRTGFLPTGVASMLSEGSSSSSARHHPHSRSSPVAQDDEVVKALGAEFAAVSRK